MIDLKDIECVEAIAKHGGINKAAEQLFTSQPALSKRLQNLEEKIGLTLFLREARGVSLTEAGQLFLFEGKKLLSHGKDFNYTVRQYGMGLEGNLAVGIKPGLDDAFLVNTICQFTKQSPHVELSVTVESTPTLAMMLKNMQIDFALCALGYHDNNDDELLRSDTIDFLPLFRIPLTVMVKKNHPWLSHCNLENLFNYALASPRPPYIIAEALRKGYAKKGIKFTQPSVVLHDYSLIKNLLLKSNMWTALFRPTRNRIEFDQRFELVPLDKLLEPMVIGLITRKNWIMSPAAYKFIDIVKKNVDGSVIITP